MLIISFINENFLPMQNHEDDGDNMGDEADRPKKIQKRPQIKILEPFRWKLPPDFEFDEAGRILFKGQVECFCALDASDESQDGGAAEGHIYFDVASPMKRTCMDDAEGTITALNRGKIPYKDTSFVIKPLRTAASHSRATGGRGSPVATDRSHIEALFAYFAQPKMQRRLGFDRRTDSIMATRKEMGFKEKKKDYPSYDVYKDICLSFPFPSVKVLIPAGVQLHDHNLQEAEDLLACASDFDDVSDLAGMIEDLRLVADEYRNELQKSNSKEAMNGPKAALVNKIALWNDLFRPWLEAAEEEDAADEDDVEDDEEEEKEGEREGEREAWLAISNALEGCNAAEPAPSFHSSLWGSQIAQLQDDRGEGESSWIAPMARAPSSSDALEIDQDIGRLLNDEDLNTEFRLLSNL